MAVTSLSVTVFVAMLRGPSFSKDFFNSAGLCAKREKPLSHQGRRVTLRASASALASSSPISFKKKDEVR